MANEDKFNLGIKALIQNDVGEILLLQVNPQQLKGSDKVYWDIPGGRIQRKSTVIETLKREVYEETGIKKMNHIEHFSTVLSNIRIPVKKGDVGLILSTYIVQSDTTQDIRLSKEHTKFSWFLPTEASKKLSFKYPKDFTNEILNLENNHTKIWRYVKKYLSTAIKKDYVLHSRMVTKAMKEIIRGEGGAENMLIPSAMLHDIGWTNVPKKFQLSDNTKEENEKALHLHIDKAPPLIKKIMSDIGYSKREIEQVIDIVVAHKFTNPEDKSKQLLIDADTLSDTYKEAFYSDVKSYNCTPIDTYNFRSKNKFYTKTARRIFKKCLKDRLSEIKSKKKGS